MAHHEMQVLTPEQSHALLQAAKADSEFEALYVLALTTGMREGELLGLTWRNVDLELGNLVVRATLRRTREGFTMAEPKSAKSRRKVMLTPHGCGGAPPASHLPS